MMDGHADYRQMDGRMASWRTLLRQSKKSQVDCLFPDFF